MNKLKIYKDHVPHVGKKLGSYTYHDTSQSNINAKLPWNVLSGFPVISTGDSYRKGTALIP